MTINENIVLDRNDTKLAVIAQLLHAQHATMVKIMRMLTAQS